MSQIILDAIEKYKPVKVLLLFSGGHDSLVSSHYAAKFLSDQGIDFTVYHGNTGIGIKETRQFVYQTVELFGWKFYEGVPPQKTYEDMVRAGGFPGPSLHYMMYRNLKERALRKYVTHTCKSKPTARENILLITGIRKSESKIRMGYKDHTRKENSMVWCSPIFYWSEDDCKKYISDYNLPKNPVKEKICISGECLCGAFAKKSEWAEIKESFPESAKEIERLHEIAKSNGFPWPWASNPAEHKKNNPDRQMKMFMCVACEARNNTLPAPTCCARWVKASDALPENMRPVRGRIDQKEEHDSRWEENEKAFMIGGKRFSPRLYFIEWCYIDQSPCTCQQELEELRTWKKVVESNYPLMQAIQEELGVKKGTEILPAIKALNNDRPVFPTREDADNYIDDNLHVFKESKSLTWNGNFRFAALAMYDWLVERLNVGAVDFANWVCTCDPEKCKDEGYRYSRQVLMELPVWSKDRQRRISEGLSTQVCIDPCIVPAIRKLWDQGIETLGCCCGHNIEKFGKAWANIAPEHMDKAIPLGYQVHPIDEHGNFHNTIYL